MKTFRVEFKQGITKEEFIKANSKKEAINKVAKRKYVECIYEAKEQKLICK